MSFFDIFKSININRGIEEFSLLPDAVLLDVRTAEEYNDGHIPRSINLPLHNIDRVEDLIQNKNTPIFVYCRSGARSARAVEELKGLGFLDARDIGGISSYKGKLEY